ncbi:hypothetical protein CTEN210_07138 [Chaetoceros tenuissimus]|uniref:Uncharacterized protein n=1 Tax=Chaetoceros tenuissimus TaxID=426638 RepID=A0AAD3CRC5_9STRA|nr:hypothetical protein CTEN210_07138 [Chaetoceros tenuissimus]
MERMLKWTTKCIDCIEKRRQIRCMTYKEMEEYAEVFIECCKATDLHSAGDYHEQYLLLIPWFGKDGEDGKPDFDVKTLLQAMTGIFAVQRANPKTGQIYFWDLLHNTIHLSITKLQLDLLRTFMNVAVVENTENVLPVEIGIEYVPNPDSEKRRQHLDKSVYGINRVLNYDEEDKEPKLLGQEGKNSFEIIFKEIQNDLNMKESKRGTFALTLGYSSLDSNAYSDNRSSILHTVNPNLVKNTTQISEKARREFGKLALHASTAALEKFRLADHFDLPNTEAGNMRRDLKKEFGRKLMMNDVNLDSMKFEGISASVVLNLNHHLDALNDPSENQSGTIAMTHYLPVKIVENKRLKKLLRDLKYTDEDSFPFTIIFYCRKCCRSAYNFAEEIEEMQREDSPQIEKIIALSILQIKGERDYDGRIFDDPSHTFLDKIIFHTRKSGQYPVKLQYDPMSKWSIVLDMILRFGCHCNTNSRSDATAGDVIIICLFCILVGIHEAVPLFEMEMEKTDGKIILLRNMMTILEVQNITQEHINSFKELIFSHCEKALEVQKQKDVNSRNIFCNKLQTTIESLSFHPTKEQAIDLIQVLCLCGILPLSFLDWCPSHNIEHFFEEPSSIPDAVLRIREKLKPLFYGSMLRNILLVAKETDTETQETKTPCHNYYSYRVLAGRITQRFFRLHFTSLLKCHVEMLLHPNVHAKRKSNATATIALGDWKKCKKEKKENRTKGNKNSPVYWENDIVKESSHLIISTKFKQFFLDEKTETTKRKLDHLTSANILGSLGDIRGKAYDTLALSKSSPISYPPTRMDPVANEKVGKTRKQPSFQESISEPSYTSTNLSFQNKAASFKQPKGRPPKGKSWDSVNGVWVLQVAGTPNLPSKDADTSKKSGNVPNKEPGIFPKPRGRPRLNCTWDSTNGKWIPNNDNQQMSKQKSKIILRDSVEIKIILNGGYVQSVPKMKYYGSWPDEKSNGRVRKASENSSPGRFKRPRGRARLGMSWNSRIGKWVKGGNKKPAPPTSISPFKEKVDYLTPLDSESNKRTRTRRSEYTFQLNLARALDESRTLASKKAYEEILETSNENNASGNLKRGEEKNVSDNLKKDEEKNGSGHSKSCEENNGKGDNVNNSVRTEEELDEINNTNGGTDHELNDLSHQAHSSPMKKTNMFGNTSFDGVKESISFANSNHGITTPTIDQLSLNASPLNYHMMPVLFSVEELNKDNEKNYDFHHPSTRNSSSGIDQQSSSSSNSAQWEIPSSREQNMDTEELTSPAIRLLRNVKTLSPCRNHEALTRIAVANQFVRLCHSPILISREQSPQNNTATTRNYDGQIPNFDTNQFVRLCHSPILISREQSPQNNTATTRNYDGQIPNFDTNQFVRLCHSPILISREQSPQNNTATTRNCNGQIPDLDNSLFSGSAIVNPPSQPSSAPAVWISPRPSSELPAIGTEKLSFTTASNHGRTISTAAHNNNLLQPRLSLGALQKRSPTREIGRQQITAAANPASTIEQQDRALLERPQAPPVIMNPAPINQPRPPVVEVYIPRNQAERQPNGQEREGELGEVPIGHEDKQQHPMVQEPEAAPKQERNHEPVEVPFQERNNQDKAVQDSDTESNGNMSYSTGSVITYSSIDNFVFKSGWGCEYDSDDSTQSGVVEPHEAARLRNLERQERKRQERLQEHQRQQHKINEICRTFNCNDLTVNVFD